MFRIDEDNSIYATRGDIVFFTVTAEDDGVPYHFEPGDVLRIKIYDKKGCENVLVEKDFPVLENAESVAIFLTEEDTKLGEVINKHKDYWYEVELNPHDDPRTIIGYHEDGPVLFRLFPEGADIPEYIPDEDDIPSEYMDDELDLTSPNPVQNRVIAAAIEKIRRDSKKDYVTPEMFGAVGDGVADDTEAVQKTVDACEMCGVFALGNRKTYLVSKPIEINKPLNVAGNGSVLKASKEMDCVLRFTNQGGISPRTIEGVTIEGNDVATVCFEIGDGNDVTSITFRDCTAHKAKQHGFLVNPIAYVVNFERCLSWENGVDGLNAVATSGDKQLNAVQVDKSSFQLNGHSGIRVNGIAISVTDSNVEKSPYGIYVGCENGYLSWNINIEGCYLEYNTDASVYIQSSLFCGVSVRNNYIYQVAKADGSASSVVQCAGSGNVDLFFKENQVEADSSVAIVDGGDLLCESSQIHALNINRVINAKTACVRTSDTLPVTSPLPMSMSSGAGFTDCRTSKNIIDPNAYNPSLKVVVPFSLTNAILHRVGTYIKTDGTTGTVRCLVTIFTQNGEQLEQVQHTYVDLPLKGDGLYQFAIVNNWLWYRIPNNCLVEIKFEVPVYGDATSVILTDLYLAYYP